MRVFGTVTVNSIMGADSISLSKVPLNCAVTQVHFTETLHLFECQQNMVGMVDARAQ
jgi:hypothetical protein